MSRPSSPLLILLFRIAYAYITIIYAACTTLGFPGAVVGLAATAVVAAGSEIAFLYTYGSTTESVVDEKEMRYLV